jgi:predicted protein tyrosine phosphatase
MADGRPDVMKAVEARAPRPQGAGIRVLFVCTAGIARSRTAAKVFEALAHASGGCETRAVGIARWAVHRLTTRQLAWADVVVVMEPEHRDVIRRFWADQLPKVHVLGIPDDYDPDEAELKTVLTNKLAVVLQRLI